MTDALDRYLAWRLYQPELDIELDLADDERFPKAFRDA